MNVLRVCLPLSLGFFVPIVSSETIFVDITATGAGTGASWVDAYTDLQPALARANPFDEIWVADGIYTPGAERESAFAMAPGVAVYGGFAGGETQLEERDPAAHPAILSGDIGQEEDPADNCFHVFHHPSGSGLDSTALLDGFTVTGGTADGYGSDGAGGGMCNSNCAPRIINTAFVDNAAIVGGGVYASGSNGRFIDVVFAGNRADLGGGGVGNEGGNPCFAQCEFRDNSAGSYGGGLSNDLASADLVGCRFVRNHAGDAGGAISNYTYAEPHLINCTLTENSATLGGAIWNGYAFPVLRNCILWGNVPEEIYGEGTAATYSDIQGGYPGEGNIALDPAFVDPETGDLRLRADSPCIDAGDPDPAYDDGCRPPGRGGARCDMGGYGGPENCRLLSSAGAADPPPTAAGAATRAQPNPFDGETVIGFNLPVPTLVRIVIFDAAGRRVRELSSSLRAPGTVRWDGRDARGHRVSAGTYLYQLRASGGSLAGGRVMRAPQ